jgi:four helix bundle protein
MRRKKKYLSLDNLKVYRLARELSKVAWKIHQSLDWKVQKVTGDQFIESVDSIGANIAEGYGRFHYLDKVKFYFNARGSLLESRHWIELLNERRKVDESLYKKYLDCYKNLKPGLSGLIKSTLEEKKKEA